jgi:putative peptidoglycan lipid II flippase
VLVLILPATVGLLILARPAIALIFEGGMFTSRDTFWTAWALRYYLVGLVFAALDWPLNYAFYARQDTLTPALVGILSVAVYLVVALALLRPLGMLGLVLADSAKHISHALTMLVLTRCRLGRLADLELAQTLGKALLATGAMAGIMVLTLKVTSDLVGQEGLMAELLAVILPITAGGLLYLGLLSLLGVEEIRLLLTRVQHRLKRSNLD